MYILFVAFRQCFTSPPHSVCGSLAFLLWRTTNGTFLSAPKSWINFHIHLLIVGACYVFMCYMYLQFLFYDSSSLMSTIEQALLGCIWIQYFERIYFDPLYFFEWFHFAFRLKFPLYLILNYFFWILIRIGIFLLAESFEFISNIFCPITLEKLQQYHLIASKKLNNFPYAPFDSKKVMCVTGTCSCYSTILISYNCISSRGAFELNTLEII